MGNSCNLIGLEKWCSISVPFRNTYIMVFETSQVVLQTKNENVLFGSNTTRAVSNYCSMYQSVLSVLEMMKVMLLLRALKARGVTPGKIG